MAKEKNELVPTFDYFVDNDVKISSGNPMLKSEIGVTKKKRRINPIRELKDKEVNESEVVETHTLNNYEDNINALKNTVVELDILAGELKADLNKVRSSQTLRGKYQYTNMLGQSISQILSTKVNAIKEINTTIKNAIELDYRMAKDKRDAEANAANDDRRIMELYNAFIGAPVSGGLDASRALLGPTAQQMTLPIASGIDTIDAVDSNVYNNYMSNLTPEQNRMILEGNPDIKEVVIYDEATGEKHFDVMNIKTGERIPNVAHHDDVFLEDGMGMVIDSRRKIARNTNINESYPLIVVNSGVDTNGF